MKTKYIFTAVIAAVAMFAGCSDNDNLELDNLQVSKSYVTIDPKGGDALIEITATEDWTMNFDVDVIGKKLDDIKGIVPDTTQTKQLELDDNAWLTVSAAEGSKGKTTVKFTAKAAESSRTSNISIKAGDKVQNLIIAQTVESKVEVVSVKDVLDGVDSKTYRVKGSCSTISNTTYGNWYMTDSDGNSLYIYGTVDETGSYNWSSFDIAVGDEVTVEGSRVTYGSTIEIKDATFIEVKKALLLSDDVSKYITKDANTLTIKVTQKGEGLYFESKADWLTIEDNGYAADSKGNLTFTVKATENTTGAAREGRLLFKSTKGSDVTELPVVITQMGTCSVDYTFRQLNSDLLQGTSRNRISFDINLKNAKVTYKNGNNIFIEDATSGLYVFSGDVTLKAGQVITGRVYGNGYAYNNLPEAVAFNLAFAEVTTPDEEVKPTEITLADLAKDFDRYLNCYVKIKGATVANAIDVKYSKVGSVGSVTDGTNTFSLNHNSTGKFNNNKIYYYVQAAKDSKVDVVCIPSYKNKTTKQLNIYEQSWITESK